MKKVRKSESGDQFKNHKKLVDGLKVITNLDFDSTGSASNRKSFSAGTVKIGPNGEVGFYGLRLVNGGLVNDLKSDPTQTNTPCDKSSSKSEKAGKGKRLIGFEITTTDGVTHRIMFGGGE